MAANEKTVALLLRWGASVTLANHVYSTHIILNVSVPIGFCLYVFHSLQKGKCAIDLTVSAVIKDVLRG